MYRCNVTPTIVFNNLSLHDALPISEGIYPIESLNPNSRFHLSLRIGYPNAFDRAQAAKEKRTNLGGDIMIHGNSVSIGCLAMGEDRKSTRLNSSHVEISYAVFCLKK